MNGGYVGVLVPDIVSLNITVARNGSHIYRVSVDQAVEIGRRQVGEPKEPLLYQNPYGLWRLIIAAIELQTVPRSLVRLDALGENQWSIANLHQNAAIAVAGSRLLPIV